MPAVNATDPTSFFGLGQSDPKGTLDMETFLMLLTVQLSTQNPLEPMNDRDFFAQMAQLGTVQGMEKLQQTMNGNQAASFIGKSVTAIRTTYYEGDSVYVTGTVKQLLMKNGEWILGVEEEGGGIVEVSLDSVLRVEE